jgi:hypothetical protein
MVCRAVKPPFAYPSTHREFLMRLPYKVKMVTDPLPGPRNKYKWVGVDTVKKGVRALFKIAALIPA